MKRKRDEEKTKQIEDATKRKRNEKKRDEEKTRRKEDETKRRRDEEQTRRREDETNKKLKFNICLLYSAVNSRISLKSMVFYHRTSNAAAKASGLL